MDRDESWDKSEFREAELRAAERERLIVGWQPPMGYRRPVDPICKAHGYGMVDGTCGVCEQIAQAEGLAELAEPPLDEAA